MTDGAATSPAPDAPDASPTTEGGAGGSVASNLPAPSLAELSKRAADEAASLDGELSEIEMLVAQATTEATRHEARRVQAEEKLTAIAGSIEPPDAGELTQQLVLLTRRSAVMEAQVDVVRGKARALGRYRDTVSMYAEALGSLANAGGSESEGGAGGEARSAADSAALSRVVLSAQEDLRREIARAMHDGPAQSLTNITLQAQIVDRLLGKDDEMARGELRLLIAMVQQTLDATKAFIFDVRPMVLDDLGLVPTLRKVARERGRRAQVAVAFESAGQDRRLPVDQESGVFRIVDDALSAFLERSPDRVTIRMDWDTVLALDVVAERDLLPQPAEEDLPAAPSADLPQALQEMIQDRRDAARPVQPDPVVLPDGVWRDLSARATMLGAKAERHDGGTRLRLEVPLPEA